MKPADAGGQTALQSAVQQDGNLFIRDNGYEHGNRIAACKRTPLGRVDRGRACRCRTGEWRSIWIRATAGFRSIRRRRKPAARLRKHFGSILQFDRLVVINSGSRRTQRDGPILVRGKHSLAISEAAISEVHEMDLRIQRSHVQVRKQPSKLAVIVQLTRCTVRSSSLTASA